MLTIGYKSLNEKLYEVEVLDVVLEYDFCKTLSSYVGQDLKELCSKAITYVENYYNFKFDEDDKEFIEDIHYQIAVKTINGGDLNSREILRLNFKLEKVYEYTGFRHVIDKEHCKNQRIWKKVFFCLKKLFAITSI